MLKDEKGDKPDFISISKESMNEIIEHIQDGMIKKLAAVENIIETDKENCAGLYTYALEEFGKMLLLKKSKLNENKYEVKYASDFVNHNIQYQYDEHHILIESKSGCRQMFTNVFRILLLFTIVDRSLRQDH